jgi:hypothetical protein
MRSTTVPTMPEARKLDVAERERAIVQILRELHDPKEGATVPDIYRRATETGVHLPGTDRPVCDDVTQPVYYKLVRRLVAAAHLVEVEGRDDAGQRYRLAETLHADTALRLDDIRELLQLRPTEALARLMDARGEYRAKRDTTIRAAAEALRLVDPRVLVFEMITARIEAYNADVDVWTEVGTDDQTHRQRIRAARAELETLCYRYLGLSHRAVFVPPGGEPAAAALEPDSLRDELARRVFGATVIRKVEHANAAAPADWSNLVIAGSDGSTYSSTMQIDTAASFSDPTGSEIVTFNTSVVYLRMEGENARRHPSPWHTVPLTRSAIDSPTNAGMVLAPFMYRPEGLSDSEYEHLAKCATDVVQWRADAEVFRGNGRSVGDGTALPSPRVHLRDGTVTPQEREANHYRRTDSYGEFVREGIRLSHSILVHLAAMRARPVFAGAVKSSQLHLFSSVVNWFIARGHPAGGVDPIDPAWDMSKGSLLPDNEAVNTLLSSVSDPAEPAFNVTFVVARPFHALTDMFRYYEEDRAGFWTERFQRIQAEHLANPNIDSWWKTVDEVADDPYVRMSEDAAYCLFYVGHSGGDPAPLAPRYEFIESLNQLPPDDAEALVDRNVGLLVAALAHSKFSLDRDHNFLSRHTLVKLVPAVVYEAHEKCKAMARTLESELKSMVIANLQRFQRLRGGPPDVRFRPVAIRDYMARYLAARSEGADEELDP